MMGYFFDNLYAFASKAAQTVAGTHVREFERRFMVRTGEGQCVCAAHFEQNGCDFKFCEQGLWQVACDRRRDNLPSSATSQLSYVANCSAPKKTVSRI